MLHTLTLSPWQCDIDALLSMLRPNDDLLLLQNGVLAAVNNSCFVEILKNYPVKTSALMEDIKARGLIGQICSKIAIISYIDFVNLVVKHRNQMNW